MGFLEKRSLEMTRNLSEEDPVVSKEAASSLLTDSPRTAAGRVDQEPQLLQARGEGTGCLVPAPPGLPAFVLAGILISDDRLLLFGA